MLLTLLAIGCTKATDDSSPTDSVDEVHPNIPEGYELQMNNGEGCGDNGTQTAAYVIGQGSTTVKSNGDIDFQGTETWYWFHGGDWSQDCVDHWEYEGYDVPKNAHGIEVADEGYYGNYRKVEPNGCEGQNYLYIWDHPDKDDFEYGELPTVQFLAAFDTVTPSGNPNMDNRFVFFHHVGKDSTFRYVDANYDTAAIITPETDVHGPPATYTWWHAFCFEDATEAK
jgi:hypothetical protein